MTPTGMLVHKNAITNVHKETEYRNLICFFVAGKQKRGFCPPSDGIMFDRDG
jgi:hypothetical protein